jgi:uncharacterized protein (TIGR03084 family)
VIQLEDICADLAAEHDDLDALVAPLDTAGWDTPTPSEGWSVRDQISHLAFFDRAGTIAITDPDAFGASLQELLADVQGFMDAPLIAGRLLTPDEVLANWRGARSDMLAAFVKADPTIRVPWYGPWMSPASFISARLMETWAHGQDVADALGVERALTDRLKHVAFLGVRARPFSYTNRGLTVPEGEVRVELTGPSGDEWTWGSGEDVVRGSALEFCLVVTQRRHLDDTSLEVTGELASEWMSIAQCFAGPPGPGRRAGQFS